MRSDRDKKYGFEDIKIISTVRHFGACRDFIWNNEVQVAVNVKDGTEGGELRAVNATTGEILYSLNLGVAAKAGPITYTHKGKQYVVQAFGGQPGFGRDEAWNCEFGSIVVGFTR